MNWTKSMQEGWYYYTTNDLDHPDGIKWMDVSITQADLDEMTITLLGPVPAPGTTWTVEEIDKYLNTFSDYDEVSKVKEFLEYPVDGIAAVTAQHGKEEG